MQLCQLIRDQVFVPSGERSCRRRVPGVEADPVAGAAAGGEGAGGGAALGGAAGREDRRDADAFDAKAAHVLATIGDMPVGTCRLRVLEESADASGTPRAWALDKLAVLERYRRQGHASAIVEQTVANAMTLPAFSGCTIVVADAPQPTTRIQVVSFERRCSRGLPGEQDCFITFHPFSGVGNEG